MLERQHQVQFPAWKETGQHTWAAAAHSACWHTPAASRGSNKSCQHAGMNGLQASLPCTQEDISVQPAHAEGFGSMLSKPVGSHLQTSVTISPLCDGSSPPVSGAPVKGGPSLTCMNPCNLNTTIGLGASCTSCSSLEPMLCTSCSALECLDPVLSAWQAERVDCSRAKNVHEQETPSLHGAASAPARPPHC